ncbi:MAG: gamma-glutamylcyclotransferase family protein [Ilumatobacteraceae bacterium]
MDATDERIERLFAYGTLQPDRLRWPFLAPFVIGHRPAFVDGTIFDTGFGWPVATFGPTGHRVPGTLVDLDPTQLAEALQVLDDVEASATDLLRRIAVTTTAGDRAWTYHCDRPPDDAVPIARWTRVDER